MYERSRLGASAAVRLIYLSIGRFVPSVMNAAPLPCPAPISCSCSFQVVKSYCGHGIGDLFHCAPNVPHYAHNKAVRTGRGTAGGRTPLASRPLRAQLHACPESCLENAQTVIPRHAYAAVTGPLHARRPLPPPPITKLPPPGTHSRA
jgi:hypothetical protein